MLLMADGLGTNEIMRRTDKSGQEQSDRVALAGAVHAGRLAGPPSDKRRP